MERVLGRDIGEEVRRIHESHGVKFHLGRSVENFDGGRLFLSDGSELVADMLVLGIGVRPSVALARQAGIEVPNGVPVDATLQTRIPGIFAAGDIALYPDPIRGDMLRIELWVAAERQGQAAAANMLGENRPYRSVPFFWSNHYDLAIRYVGSSAKWDRIEMDGSAADGNCTARYFRASRLLAAASIGRDKENLEIEHMLEQQIAREAETVSA
jgi:3-phenylpropionate/trans-cinnamate dioxygenase ferredoxin reductase subunit